MAANLCSAMDGHEHTIHVVGEEILSTTNLNGTEQQFEVVRAIYEPLGYKVNTSVLPYKRALKMVENGSADMMVGMLKDRQLRVNYSDSLHVADKLIAILTLDKLKEWQDVYSLENKNITVQSGFSTYLNENFPQLKLNLMEVNSREQAFNKLKFGHTDYLIDSESSYVLAKKRNELATNFITKHIGYLEVYAAFTINDHGLKIKEEWDKSFLEFIYTNQARDIFEKWGMAREHRTTLEYFKKN